MLAKNKTNELNAFGWSFEKKTVFKCLSAFSLMVVVGV